MKWYDLRVQFTSRILTGLGIVTFVLEFPTKLLKLRSQAGRLAETELTPAGGILRLTKHNNKYLPFLPSFPPSIQRIFNTATGSERGAIIFLFLAGEIKRIVVVSPTA